MFSLGRMEGDGVSTPTLDELQARTMRAVSGDGFLLASCVLSDDVSTLTSVKWLALGIMVIGTLPSSPPPPLFGGLRGSLVPAALPVPSYPVCAHCFWFSKARRSKREWCARQHGELFKVNQGHPGDGNRGR